MKKFLYTLGRRQRGETILEVLVAIGIVVICGGVSASLIVTGFNVNNYNREYLVASSLASGGIAYMNSLVESNKQRFGFDAMNCWDMLPGVTECKPSNKIADGNYLVQDLLGKNSANSLVSASTSVLNLQDGISSGDKAYEISTYDLNTNLDSDGNGVKDDDKDYFGRISSLAVGQKKLDSGKYYALIKITSAPGKLDYQSEVQWLQGGQFRKIVLNGGDVR